MELHPVRANGTLQGCRSFGLGTIVRWGSSAWKRLGCSTKPDSVPILRAAPSTLDINFFDMATGIPPARNEEVVGRKLAEVDWTRAAGARNQGLLPDERTNPKRSRSGTQAHSRSRFDRSLKRGRHRLCSTST